MKTFWILVAVLLALVGSCRPPGSSRSSKPRPVPTAAPPSGNRMNVLLITIDTLRADHLGLYGYKRNTSPRLDAFAKESAVFEQAYTYWPKTRGSFVMMMTGRRPSQNGYSKKQPMVLGFNATIASTLKEAGYQTLALVDNPNVAAQHGYSKGFDRYRETWLESDDEVAKASAITTEAATFLESASPDRPFFAWLHYVNPHAPYTPPPPYDTMFLDAAAASGATLKPVTGGFHGGVNEKWEVAGKRLGYYVAQYDGEIAAVDQEVGKVLDALARGPAAASTVVVVSSDHGESLGEHDYYFDHGEDLFDPCLRIPLIVHVPGAPAGLRSEALVSTLDFLPTILDAVKVSYPPDLGGRSVLSEVAGRAATPPDRLFAQNEHHHSATFDMRLKTIAIPDEARGYRFSMFDRASDPEEARDISSRQAEALRIDRRELELYFDRMEREWGPTRAKAEGQPPAQRIPPDVCAKLRGLGYVGVAGCD